MDHDPKAYLFDIIQACDEIEEFTLEMSLEKYSGNSMVKGRCGTQILSDWRGDDTIEKRTPGNA